MKRMKRATALILAAAITFSNCPPYTFVGKVEASDMMAEPAEEILVELPSEPEILESETPVMLTLEEASEPELILEDGDEPEVIQEEEAAEIVASGSCGTTVTWSLDTTGLLRIQGEGRMRDYSQYSYVSWYSYRNQITSAIVDEGVTYLGHNVFFGTMVKSVSLPSTLEGIGSYAFYGCTALTKLELPDSITSIGGHTFYGCTNLSEIKLPKGLKAISGNMFVNCTSLLTVAIPEGVTTIGTSAFSGCTALTNITLPDGLTTIESNGFYGCTALKEVTFPEGFTNLGTYAFYNCKTLTSLAFPESLKNISDYSFYACSGLQGTLEIPDTITRIGNYSFANCTAISTLKLGANVESIGNRAFYGCKLTGTLEIPDSVKTIENYAFYGNSTLTEIIFGSGLETLGTSTSYAPFYGCSGVHTVTFKGETPPSIPANPFSSMSNVKTIWVPKAAYGAYASKMSGWLSSSRKIKCLDAEEEMVIIDDVLVAYQGTATNVVIPEGVTKIGNGAFNYNTTITSVTIPSTVTEIGSYAFYRCSALKSVNLPEETTVIGSSAFYYCPALTSINLHDGITSIGSYAFYNCTALAVELNLTDALTYLGAYAFYNCSKITGSVYISDAITELGTYAFYSCSSLDGTLRLPEGLTSIGSYAFSYCSKLKGELNLPDSLTTLGSGSFYCCSGFTGKLVLPTGLTTVPNDAFRYCMGITGELVIPSNITTINSCAFANMTGVTSIVVPATVKTMSNDSLAGMTGLKTLAFETLTPSSLPYSSLSSMTGLEAIYVPAGVFTTYVEKFTGYIPANARIMSLDAEDDFLIEDGVLLSYQGEGGEVVVPDQVTAIAKYAFNGCTTVTKIALPEAVETEIDGVITMTGGITSIGDYAFRNCTALTQINIPDTVESIGIYAFYNCAALTGIELPEGLTTIKEYTFYGCSAMAGTLKIPDSVKSVNQYAFYNCSSLEAVELGNGVTRLDNYAFQNCAGMKSLKIGSSLQTIGQYAFNYCAGLEALDFGDAVTSVGAYAFQRCTGMKSLNLGTTVTTIGTYAFAYCSGLEGDLVIPDSVTSLGSYAFYNCSGINGTLKLSENLTEISAYTFSGCTQITGQLVIPDKVVNINNRAFHSTKITSLIVGSGVTTFGTSTTSSYNPVYSCTSLTEITFTGLTPPSVKSSGFPSSLKTVYVPQEAYGEYNTKLRSYLPAKTEIKFIGADSDFVVDDGVLVGYLGKDTEITLPEDITGIGPSVFYNNTSITKVVIPDTVTSIGESAFYNCTNLQTLEFPSGLTQIGNYAFCGCKKMTGPLVLTEGLTSVGEYAFYNCNSLTGELKLPDTLTTLGMYAFYYCYGLTGTLKLPSNLTTIPNYAFSNCSGVTGEVIIPDSVTTIGDNAFYNLNKITGITFGSGITKIGNNTSTSYTPFYYCHSVKTVTFKGTVPPTIMGSMFYSMGYMETAYVPAESYTAYSNALSSILPVNAKIRVLGQEGDFLIVDNVLVAYLGEDTQVEIPSGVTAIGNAAFQNYSSITSVTIPDTVTAIGDYAFKGCTSLAGELVLADQLTTIGQHAFDSCTSLTGSLVIPDSVTELGAGAFYNCSGLNGSLTLSKNLTTLNKDLFYNCKFTGTVVVPDSVTKMDDNALRQLTGITEVVIGSGVKTFGYNSGDSYSVFYGCTNLERITFTGPLPTIYQNVFSGLSKLKTVGVPGEYVSDYVNKWLAAVPIYTRIVAADVEEEMLIRNGVLLAYQGVGGDVVIPENVTAIGPFVFNGCTEMTTITFSGAVRSIGDYAFRGCTGLTGIDLPDTLQDLGKYAFYGCTAMGGKLIIPDSLGAINPYTFYNCSSLTGLDLGKGLLSIGEYAFCNCKSLSGDLVIPDSVSSLARYMFSSCSKLNGSLTLSQKLTEIPDYAFEGAKFTGDLVIPDRVTTIGDRAFAEMAGLESVVFGAKVAKIGYSTYEYYTPFYNCTGLKTMTFMSLTVPTFGGNVFTTLSGLETIYVFEEAYDAYVAALSGYLSDSVTISTDFLVAKINNLMADRVYSKTIALSWNPHTSSSVVGYTISCNGEVIGTTENCSYVVRDLEPNGTYTYTVQGYTADDRTTTATQVTVTTALPEIRDIRTASSVNKINDASNTISIYVRNSKNLLPLDGETTTCILYCGDVAIGEATLSPNQDSSAVGLYTLDWDLSGWEDGSYDIRVCLTDIDGASAEYTETLIIDRGIPEQIIGLTAVGDVNVIHINWATAAEADTNIYRIYRRTETDDTYRLIAQINNRDTLSYTDKNIKTDRVYYYYVVGVNELNQEGVPSLVVGATLAKDRENPVVTKLSPANGTYLKGTVKLTMTAEDNVQVTYGILDYSVDDGQNWTEIARVEHGRLYTDFDTTQVPDGIIQVRAIAYDAAGNASAPLIYTYAIDNYGPEQVRGLSYESTHVSITLRWKNVSDEDIWYYQVEQKLDDGSYTTLGKVYDTLGINIYDLIPGTSYTYRVVGYDRQNNRGTPSEDIVAKTLLDSIPPVITSIRPGAGYYAHRIPLAITATDEYQLRSITIQTSLDLLNWKDTYTQNYVGINESQTLSYNLDLEGYKEGSVYVRAVARDTGGNTSDTSVKAPYVQYIVDRTAPAAPGGVKAIGQCGYIEISWVQGAENDLDAYALYRAEGEDGEFELLAENIRAINYLDRDVTEGQVYYYKVAVTDKAGNRSEYAETVFAEVGVDTEVPQILTIYPAPGSLMGPGNNSVSVTVTDNHMLQSLLIEYGTDGTSYETMYSLTNISEYGQYAAATVPVSEFQDGDVVYLRISAKDQTGNVSEYFYASYTIDAIAPEVHEVDAQYRSEDEAVWIRWMGAQEEDLYGYRIYRVVKDVASLVGFCPAGSDQVDYEYLDTKLPVERTFCTYRVEAVDKCGNTSSVSTAQMELPDRQFPRAILYCDNTMEVNVEHVFDASASTDNSAIVSYLIDFGDGTTSTEPTLVHVYENTGEYLVSLTVEDDDGHVTTVQKTITVVDRAAIGTVKILVVDENGRALRDAPVYFDLGDETQTMKLTDSTGCAIFTSTAGVHAVGCLIANNEWLPAKKDVVILAGAQTTVTLTLVHQALIEGVFEVNRMTFEEIKAAGIDVSKPENQHIVSVGVKLTYGSVEQETSFIFNMVTQESIGDVVYDSDNDNKPDREIIPVILSKDTIAYLDIPIGASLLKEFFDVRLRIINNAASEFEMTDNIITLNVPDGMTIVEAIGTQSSAVVEIDKIPGQSERTISWILRGDQEGEYHLSADYSGRISQFDEPIHTTFLSKEPIKVYGLSAVKLIAEVNSTVNLDAFYFNLSLENTSDINMNLPSIEVVDQVLTSYLKRVTEGEDDEDMSNALMSKPTVRHLNTMLTNSSGYRQYIGTETAVQTLAPGEKLTNQYAVYHVAGYNNLMLLQNSIYEIAEAYGIRFELIQTDMDLFSTDQAMDKLADIGANAHKKAQYEEVLDCSRYFYVLESLDRDTNVFVRQGRDLYAAMIKRLAIDANYSAEATAQVTRLIVGQLMVDESMQQAINASVSEKYLAVTTSLLNKIREQLPENELVAWDDAMNTPSRVRNMADKLEKFGLAYFANYLVPGMGLGADGEAKISAFYNSGEMARALSESVSGISSLVAQTVEKLFAVAPSWSDSAELVDALIRVAAAQDEMHRLLDMLTEHTTGQIHKALVAIQDGLGDVETLLADQFAAKLDEAMEAEGGTAAVLACLNAVYGAGTGASYTLVKLTFGSVDQVTNWTGVTTDRHVLSVCTAVSLALRQAVEQYGLSAKTEDQAKHTMWALKYLIKMRLMGEQCFVNAMDHLSGVSYKDALAWVNGTMETQYESLDAYYRETQIRLLGYRDHFFSSYYTNLEIPEAPQVTIDYQKAATVEEFSSDYEYSFDGAKWNTCKGGTITFTPGTVNRYLWVRVKASGSNAAGNITKVVIPAMPRLTGDVTMMYVEDGYEISGLKVGTYLYAFTNDKKEPTFTKSFTVADGEIIRIQAENSWTYMALRTPASETAFASQVRYLVAEKPWIIDTDTYLVTGMVEQTSSMQVVNYYGAKGYNVTVVSPDGKTTEMVGTGCWITLDGERYSALVVGDVDGNASIDLFDLMDVLCHLNSEKELEGVYCQAGQICDGETISLFDLMALISYLNTGSFGN